MIALALIFRSHLSPLNLLEQTSKSFKGCIKKIFDIFKSVNDYRRLRKLLSMSDACLTCLPIIWSISFVICLASDVNKNKSNWPQDDTKTLININQCRWAQGVNNLAISVNPPCKARYKECWNTVTHFCFAALSL